MKKFLRELNSHNILYYILVFFAMVICIILVMGSYLYRFYYRTIYADFCQENERRLLAIVSRHEDDVQIMDNIITQMGLSDDITRFMLEQQPQKANRLEDRLNGYAMVSQFFNFILYYYHEDNYLYNHVSSVNMDIFLKSGLVLDGVSEEEMQEFLDEKTTRKRILPEQAVGGKWLNTYLANENKVVYVQAIPPLCEETMIFFVPDSYFDALMESDVQERRLDFLYYDGQLIVTRGSEQAVAEELGGQLINRKAGTERIELNGKNYLLSLQQGKSSIIYGCLQSMDIFHRKMMYNQWGIIVLMLVCAVPVSMAIVMVFGRLGRKVKNLNLLLNDDASYDLSSIENGIQTLITSRNESEKERILLKRTRFVRDFIRGIYSTKEEVAKAAQEAEFSGIYSRYLVVLIRSREISNESRVYSAMLEIIEQENNAEGYGVHMIGNNQNLFVLFADSEEEIEKLLQKLLELEQKHCKDYIMATSDYHSEVEEGSRAFLEASTAFDNYLLVDNSKVIRFSDVSQKDYVNYLPEHYLQKLRYAIRGGDESGMKAAVKDICDRLNGENASLYAFRILYNDIIHVILSEWKGAQSELNDFYNVFTLTKCLNIQDFQDLLCEACMAVIDKQEGIAMQNSHIVREATAYMQEHFADPNLTMNALADHIHVSPVTLAVEFRDEMDVRPSDYLANLRMEKAKELLRDTSMLVGDIALAVGYEDAHVFRRRFKKYTGMTPGEYRGE